MASGMSDYLENKIVDHIFKQTPFTAPSTLYVALFTVSPGETNAGTEVSTISTGYGRVALNPSSSGNWTNTQGTASGVSTGSSGTTMSLSDVQFSTPTADWGTVVAFGLYDAPTGGNLLFYGALTSTMSIVSGSTAKKFPAGSLAITFN